MSAIGEFVRDAGTRFLMANACIGLASIITVHAVGIMTITTGVAVVKKSIKIGNAMQSGLLELVEFTCGRQTEDLIQHNQATEQQTKSVQEISEGYRQAAQQIKAIDLSHQESIKDSNQQIANTIAQIKEISSLLQENARSVSHVSPELMSLNTSINQANATLNQILENNKEEIKQLREDKERIINLSKLKISELKEKIRNLEAELINLKKG